MTKHLIQAFNPLQFGVVFLYLMRILEKLKVFLNGKVF